MIRFTEQDLLENRNGRFSTPQCLPFLLWFGLRCLLLILILSVVSVAIFNPMMFDWFMVNRWLRLGNIERTRAFEILLASVFATVVVITMRDGYRDLFNPVCKVQGVAHLYEKQGVSSRLTQLLETVYVVEVHKQAFKVSNDVFMSLKDQQRYAVYYTRGSRKVLSIEEIE